MSREETIARIGALQEEIDILEKSLITPEISAEKQERIDKAVADWKELNNLCDSKPEISIDVKLNIRWNVIDLELDSGFYYEPIIEAVVSGNISKKLSKQLSKSIPDDLFDTVSNEHIEEEVFKDYIKRYEKLTNSFDNDQDICDAILALEI